MSPAAFKTIAAPRQAFGPTARRASTVARVAPAIPATRPDRMSVHHVPIGQRVRNGLGDLTLVGLTLLVRVLLDPKLLDQTVADQKLHHALVLASVQRNLMPVRRA